MFIQPSSTVCLYKNVDITGDMRPIFRNKENQRRYFASRMVTNKAECSYIRKTGKVRIEWPTSQIVNCNYISFTNENFEGVTFYALLVDYEYVNNVTTDVIYEIDWFQTLMFDVKYEYGKIDREHLSTKDYARSLIDPFDYSIYEFQTAENLPAGRELEEQYAYSGSQSLIPQSLSTQCVVMQVADFDLSTITEENWEGFTRHFNIIIESDGRISKGASDLGITTGFISVPVGRGYGMYVISPYSTDNPLYEQGQGHLRLALDWMTYRGISGQIIGIFQMPFEIFKQYCSPSNDLPTWEYDPQDYDVVNKKLLLSPYQYLRVDNGQGDTKEYKYEKFLNPNRKSDESSFHRRAAAFKYIPLLDGTPMVSLVPMNYLDHFTDGVVVSGDPNTYNVDERIDIHQIPQVGYTTDAYLAFLNSQYAQNIASRTNNLAGNMNLYAGALSTQLKESGHPILSGLVNIMGSGGARMISSAGQFLSGDIAGGLSTIAGAAGGLSTANLTSEAINWAGGSMPEGLDGDFNDGVFGLMKPAFISDEYHAGSTNGTLGLHLPRPRNTGTFRITRVKLRDEILKAYDDFFSGYGYASNRVGIPRICNYITGEGDQPQFMDFMHMRQTYVKTSYMHVTHNMLAATRYIETMFNNGCHFLRGEDLYENNGEE